jgi:C-3',4' desaturase CrtD
MSRNRQNQRIFVIGAGIGGLTTAAVLARAGLDVQVLEAHVYPGGCAGTFYYQGYRFDAGATLAGGFYPGGPMDCVAQATGVRRWPTRPAEPAMTVHLSDGQTINRWGDHRRWDERRRVFGPEADTFWRWQERSADALWRLALKLPPWPPQSYHDVYRLLEKGTGWLIGETDFRHLPGMAADAFRPVSTHLQGVPEALRQFVDGQLLISAQVPSARANALFGAAALDLPRRGVVHLESGMGAIAEQLVEALRGHGGQIHYRTEAKKIITEKGRPVAVETRRGEIVPADIIISNLPPWNIAKMLGDPLPPRLQALPEKPTDGWGAFMVYVGLDGAAIPEGLPLHHQVLTGEELAEGNSVFLSLSPEWDLDRAPFNRRAITLSTHTELATWWALHEADKEAYEGHKEIYTRRLLDAVERVIPDIREAADIILPGTPLSFQRFTRRQWGWVGGFPQTSLFRAWGPRLGEGLWMVGDSIFPGQSTPAVALGGLRVARTILNEQYGLAQDPLQGHQQPSVSLGDEIPCTSLPSPGFGD